MYRLILCLWLFVQHDFLWVGGKLPSVPLQMTKVHKAFSKSHKRFIGLMLALMTYSKWCPTLDSWTWTNGEGGAEGIRTAPAASGWEPSTVCRCRKESSRTEHSPKTSHNFSHRVLVIGQPLLLFSSSSTNRTCWNEDNKCTKSFMD